MNTESIDFRFLAESDGSPLIVFNHKGHVVYLNDAAEILLGYVDHRELFQIALANAPQDFGGRTILMDLHFHQLSFYAITVAYNSEEWVSLRLYYRPRAAEEHKLDSSRLRLTDLNLLLDMAIGFYSVEHSGSVRLLSDRDLPPFLTDQNHMTRLLRKSLESFAQAETVKITLTMVPGEYLLIDGRRHPVLRLQFQGDRRSDQGDRSLAELAEEIGASGTFESQELLYEIPFIRE